MTNIVWVVGILWLGVLRIAFYNLAFRFFAQEMLSWMESQFSTIEDHPDYREEAFHLHNVIFPQVRGYVEESIGFGVPLFYIQAINTLLIILALYGGVSYILNVIAAFGNAAIIVSLLELRKRKYIIYGLCGAVGVIIEAISIQNRYESETPDERGLH